LINDNFILIIDIIATGFILINYSVFYLSTILPVFPNALLFIQKSALKRAKNIRKNAKKP